MSNHLTLSPSGLTTWSLCRRKFHYVYDRGWRGRGSLAASFGSALHSALDTVWLQATAGRPMDDIQFHACDSFDKTLGERWPREIPEDERLYTHENGYEIIHGYIEKKLDKIRGFQLVGVEEALYVDYPEIGASLGGRVDKVYRDANGWLMVLDHKTTKAGSGKAGIYENFWSQFVVNRQIDVYLLAASKRWAKEHIGGLVVDAILVNTASRVYESRLFARDKAHLEAMEQEFKDTVSDIAEARSRGSFPRAMNDACTAYGGCQHRLLCTTYPDRKNLPENPPAELADVIDVVRGTTAQRLGLDSSGANV